MPAAVEVFAPFPEFEVWVSMSKDGTITAKGMSRFTKSGMDRREEVIPPEHHKSLKPEFLQAIKKTFGA